MRWTNNETKKKWDGGGRKKVNRERKKKRERERERERGKKNFFWSQKLTIPERARLCPFLGIMFCKFCKTFQRWRRLDIWNRSEKMKDDLILKISVLHKCYTTETCKALMNTPHSKI